MTPTAAETDANQRRFDLLEAAAREAILHGEAALCVRVPVHCAACGAWDEAVWFHSRGWVCLACEDEARGGVAPTPAQRRIGGVTANLWSAFRRHAVGG